LSRRYIKELADRVSSLEGQLKFGNGELGPGVSHEDNLFIENSYSGAGSGPKRTHSMSEGLSDHYSASGRTGFQPQSDQSFNLQFDEGLASL
jgi:hypothetical protein